MSKKEILKKEEAVEETAVETAVVAEEAEAVAKKPAKKPAKKKAKAEVAEPAVDAGTEEVAEEVTEEDIGAETEAVAEEKPKKKRSAAKKKKTEVEIVTISGERSVLTDDDKFRADLLDTIESKKINKILSDTITGVEKHGDMTCAVLQHGLIKVIIPAQLLVMGDNDGKTAEEVNEEYANNAIRRLGAEVDYVVEKIDEEEGVAVASRVKAMALKQKRYYLSFDKKGNKIIYPGAFCEARIVSVARTGVFVEIFGVETFIRFPEITYKRIASAEDEFSTGMRVLVKILDVKIEDKKILVSASIKQAQNNPLDEAIKKFSVNNLYTGKVTMVDTNGVFVSLDGGVDCLCRFPDRGRPVRGARATVRVLGVDAELNKVWGVIIHMSNAR